jgi:hypothetical protein
MQVAQWEELSTQTRFGLQRTIFKGWLGLFCLQLVLCFALVGLLKRFTGGMTVGVVLQNLAWASLIGMLLGAFRVVARSGEMTITISFAHRCSWS